MHKFFRNLIVSAVVLVCGIALYQVRQSTTAEYFDGVVVTSVSSGYLSYTGTSFVVQYVALSSLVACGPNLDVVSAYLSDSINSGTVSGKPSISGTICNMAPGRTGTINVGTTYQNFTGSTLYLHIFVRDYLGTLKGYGEQEITFVASGAGGPDWASIYTDIGNTISSSGIRNNFTGVTNDNVTAYSGLYFAKMSGSTELGRITFSRPLDLTDTGVQSLLQNLGSGEVMDMSQGYVKFSPGAVAAMNSGATVIMMFGSGDTFVQQVNNASFFEVTDSTGNIVDGSGFMGDFVGACEVLGPCSIMFSTDHFTEFELKPFLTAVNITSNAGTGVWSGNTVYVSFTGNETITGVSVTIAGQAATIVGGGNSYTASYVLTAGGTVGSGVSFTINFRNYAGTSGNQVTSVTDSSYVNYRLISTDSTLNTFTISTGTLSPTFASGTTSYTVTYPYSFTGTVTITGTKNNTYASITSGSYSLSLPTAGSTGSMFITVQSQSGNTTTYTVNIARAAASTDATLSNLTVSTGTLSPAFSSGTTGYTLQMPYSYTGTITSTPVVSNTYATVSGTTSLALNSIGSTGLLVSTVTAEDGTTTKTYTITITRAAASTDATLSNLTVSTGTLSPSFSSGTTGYTVNFPYSFTGTVTITPTKNNSYATVTGTNSITLSTAGSTGSIVSIVTAEDGTTTKTYTVTITRTPLSSDANLSSLTVSTGTLSPSFSSGTITYTVQMAYSYTGTLTITGVKNYSAATTTGNMSATLATAGSTGSMYITVIAEDTTTKTYTVTITRAAASTDATLSNLTVSTGTLSPSFSSGTTGYTVNFPYSFTGTVIITPTKNNSYATVTGTNSITLSTAGSTGSIISIVTAEDGTTTKTYTVTITRTAASTDANLSSLTLSTGTLSPTFSSGTTSYTVQMLYSFIGTITSTPIASNAYATLSGTTSLNLSSAGSTGSLSTLVTAENGTTTKTYTIAFTRSTPTAVATTSINGTVTVTGGSADLSGATSTGATFTSTGTLHIVGDTTNDYIELSVSGVIITASGGTRDGVLLAPTDLISGDSNNATITELGLNSSTNTVLLTVQAGSNTDSLTITGGYFNLSFVVPGGTAGDVIKLYRSENGSTWTANTPDATCTLTAGLVCSFRTNHLSYFTTVKETTTSGGGGGGGGGSTTTTGDNDVAESTTTRGSGNIEGSTYPDEWNFAYLYAYDLGITTMKTVKQANMEGNLIRSHMAKMMVNYAIKALGKYPDTTLVCEFDDIENQTAELKNYIKRACQLGLMGQGINNFNPSGEVTRAQFGTVLSRALYNNQYNGGEPYYLNHLNALKTKGIINNTDATLKEIRAYVMLMLMRADK